MSVFRTVVGAFKSEFGKSRNTNPWPRCTACFHRLPPSAICPTSDGHLAGICRGCCPHAGNHPERDDRDHNN